MNGNLIYETQLKKGQTAHMGDCTNRGIWSFDRWIGDGTYAQQRSGRVIGGALQGCWGFVKSGEATELGPSTRTN